MFDIGFLELLVVMVVGLIVIGPERLPEAIKTGAIWFSRFKRSVREARTEFEQQIGADEIRREIHNEQIMDSMKAIKDARTSIENQIADVKQDLEESVTSTAEAANAEGENASDTEDSPVSTKPATSAKLGASAKNRSTKTAEVKSPAKKRAPKKKRAASKKSPPADEPHAPMIGDDLDDGESPAELPGRKQSRARKQGPAKKQAGTNTNDSIDQE